jgi:DNA-binding transcriptional regulator YiaG
MQETHSRSTNLDIYAIRRRARRTQEQFADALGIPANTVRSWEQRRKRPSGAARKLDLNRLARRGFIRLGISG